jgi:hypothetical protein
MKNLPTYEEHLIENTIYAKDEKTALFNADTWYTDSSFIKIAKTSDELKTNTNPKADLPRTNADKGVYVLMQLKKKLPYKFVVKVHRSEWNHGGNLILTIRLAGNNDSVHTKGQFEFKTNNGSKTTNYAFGDLFHGVINDEKKAQKAGTYYGDYQSISHIDGVIDSIVYYAQLCGGPEGKTIIQILPKK